MQVLRSVLAVADISLILGITEISKKLASFD